MNLSVIKNSEPKIGPSDIYVSTTGHNLSLVIDNLIQFDITFEDNGVTVVVDKKSEPYLQGTVLDFTGGIRGKGFFFSNPNADRTCGCGESFSI